jgi:hypothetical protein
VAVGVFVGDGVAVRVNVGVLAIKVTGAEVTWIDTLTRIVRALVAVIVRGVKGTNFNIGVKSLATVTETRLVLPVLGINVLSDVEPAEQ